MEINITDIGGISKPPKPEELDLEFTESACDRVMGLMIAADEDVIGLRVAVKSGGCAGYQYVYSLETKTDEYDTIIEQDGATFIVDSSSAMKLEGATLDYQRDLMSEQFVMHNPGAGVTCGCGISFG